jgi:hypothetical protein
MKIYTKEDIKAIRDGFGIYSDRRIFENTLKYKEMMFNSEYPQHRELVTQEEIDELKEILK